MGCYCVALVDWNSSPLWGILKAKHANALMWRHAGYKTCSESLCWRLASDGK
jgi:hypothetical protein